MICIVSTADRPDLVPVTGRWRWEAFFRDEMPLEDMLRREAESAANGQIMPTVLVMLDSERPIGMVALCLDDLEGMPEMNPWLAGVYVTPSERGKGYALRLVEELEHFARNARIQRLSLYTSSAASLYAKANWALTQTVERNGRTTFIMQKNLS
jgi:GNAT superfamily N-acetyltransferase